MTPQVCLVGGFDGEIPGDCLRACVATVLDLDAKDMPHFYRDYKPDQYDAGVRAMEELKDFLRPMGLAPVVLPTDQAETMEDAAALFGIHFGDVPFLLFGRTGQSDHVVVCQNGEFYFDPSWGPASPNLTRPEDGIWIAMIFGKL